jgi:hypothetical protein
VKKYFDIYKGLLLEAGHSEAVIRDALSWTTHTYQLVHVAETDEQARDEMMTILRSYQDAIERRPNSTPAPKATKPIPRPIARPMP